RTDPALPCEGGPARGPRADHPALLSRRTGQSTRLHLRRAPADGRARARRRPCRPLRFRRRLRMPAEPAWSLHEVTRSYGAVRAVDAVSLAFARGDITVLIGSSG